MDSKLTAYRRAAEQHNQAKKAWRELATRLKQSAHWLATSENPEHFQSMLTADKGPLRADLWPSANVITVHLQEYAETKARAEAAYNEIPEDDRPAVTKLH